MKEIIQTTLLLSPVILMTIDYHNRVKEYPKLSERERSILRHMINLSIMNFGDNKELELIYKKLGGKIK